MQERKDLEKLAFRDITLEAREAWKSEISVLFRELHDKFDTQLGQIRSELESQFKRKARALSLLLCFAPIHFQQLELHTRVL